MFILPRFQIVSMMEKCEQLRPEVGEGGRGPGVRGSQGDEGRIRPECEEMCPEREIRMRDKFSEKRIVYLMTRVKTTKRNLSDPVDSAFTCLVLEKHFKKLIVSSTVVNTV